MSPPNQGGYEVEFSSRGSKQFLHLPLDAQQRLLPKIKALRSEPRPRGCEKLEGFKNAYRIRVGGYRIVFEVDDEQEVVTIARIGSRGQVYKGLDL